MIPGQQETDMQIHHPATNVNEILAFTAEEAAPMVRLHNFKLLQPVDAPIPKVPLNLIMQLTMSIRSRFVYILY